ncbi:hypothetical protein J3454_12380 [Erythrobacter sp. NFXS35]|uniref:hypothetical protein n=1 Tax=Erythrobacter sp. NFXS35 TaxID=2818436 RepID=UPI0032DEF844
MATALVAALALHACKPPPTDAATARADSLPLPAAPSTPLPSPDTTGAVWAASGGPEGATPMRLVYGIPGEPVLLALECLEPGTPDARLRISRQSPADKGAGALLALIGNGYIGRFPVDSTDQGGRLMWQGEVPADAQGWNALIGQREATATVPGAGLVRLNPSPLPAQLVEACRAIDPPEPPEGQA